jgi:hypothetical protein
MCMTNGYWPCSTRTICGYRSEQSKSLVHGGVLLASGGDPKSSNLSRTWHATAHITGNFAAMGALRKIDTPDARSVRLQLRHEFGSSYDPIF